MAPTEKQIQGLEENKKKRLERIRDLESEFQETKEASDRARQKLAQARMSYNKIMEDKAERETPVRIKIIKGYKYDLDKAEGELNKARERVKKIEKDINTLKASIKIIDAQISRRTSESQKEPEEDKKKLNEALNKSFERINSQLDKVEGLINKDKTTDAEKELDNVTKSLFIASEKIQFSSFASNFEEMINNRINPRMAQLRKRLRPQITEISIPTPGGPAQEPATPPTVEAQEPTKEKEKKLIKAFGTPQPTGKALQLIKTTKTPSAQAAKAQKTKEKKLIKAFGTSQPTGKATPTQETKAPKGRFAKFREKIGKIESKKDRKIRRGLYGVGPTGIAKKVVERAVRKGKEKKAAKLVQEDIAKESEKAGATLEETLGAKREEPGRMSEEQIQKLEKDITERILKGIGSGETASGVIKGVRQIDPKTGKVIGGTRKRFCKCCGEKIKSVDKPYCWSCGGPLK